MRPTRVFRRRNPASAPRQTPPSSVLGVDKALIEQFIANHNKQGQSPLFDQIPPEVRNTIFLYALLSYEDLGTIYQSDEHYVRPSYHHPSRIDPSLLQTCRLIYLETRFLPVMADEHAFWCHRPPPGLRYSSDPRSYFNRFSEEQKDHVDRVHFFTQQYYLEGHFSRDCALADMRPRSLKITLRHGDWWFWEDNKPLHLKDGWARGFKDSRRLEEVILELETIERDKDQIYAIANRVSKETYPLPKGRILSTAGNPLIKREWMGPSHLPGVRSNKTQSLRFDKTQSRWIERDSAEEQYFPDPGLKYCIVLIKWTAVEKS